MQGKEGRCTKCGYVGVVYYMKPHYDWCAGCMKQVIVNTPIKFRSRPTYRDLKPAFNKIKQELADLREKTMTQKECLHELEQIGTQQATIHRML